MTDPTKDQHVDLLQFNRDQLFYALRLALPAATHEQVLNVTRAMESLAAAVALETMSL